MAVKLLRVRLMILKVLKKGLREKRLHRKLQIIEVTVLVALNKSVLTLNVKLPVQMIERLGV